MYLGIAIEALGQKDNKVYYKFVLPYMLSWQILFENSDNCFIENLITFGGENFFDPARSKKKTKVNLLPMNIEIQKGFVRFDT